MSISSRPWIARSLVLALAGLVACSAPPRGVQSDPERPLPAPPADEAAPRSGESYAFEREGEFPPPAKDVVFEEDQLPPRPENVDAVPIEGRSVRAADVEGPAEAEPTARQSPTVRVPVESTVPTPVQGAPVPMRMGFRVQLIAAADRVEAETFAREARARLGVAVHIDFEAPYYKVRAGDFLDRADALAMRDRARANGYEGAWVTATRVVDSGDSDS